MTKTLFTFAIVSLVISAQAQTKPNSPSNQNGVKGQSVQALRSEELGDLLNATNEARIAVEARNSQDASIHIDHALQNATRLEGDTKNGRIVPLYQELDRYTVLAPIMAEKNRTSNTNTGSPGTNTAAKANRTPNAAIQQVTGQYTSVGLDIQAAKEHLDAAKAAIQKNDFTKADEALAAVQNGVVVTSVASDLPLVRARENMVLAREAVNRGNFKEAHAALTAASQALGKYAGNQGVHSVEARTVKSQIDNFNQSIEQNHADADSKIDSWWSQVVDWTPAPTEQSRR
jgi:hypothetical protein